MDEDSAAKHESRKPSAFLDTNVIVSFLKGDRATAHIFDPEVSSHVRYAVNPIVVQELFLLGESDNRQRIEDLISENRISVLPIDPDKTSEILNRAKSLRDNIAHSNNVLIVSSATGCDYLVTKDKELGALAGDETSVVSPEQFVAKVLGRP